VNKKENEASKTQNKRKKFDEEGQEQAADANKKAKVDEK